MSSEATSQISITGQLIELSSTDLPTTIVIRKNPDGEFKDYTVEIGVDAKVMPTDFPMSSWITGDFVALNGTLNENTGVVSAVKIQNISLNPFEHKSLNGFVESVDTSKNKMTISWAGQSFTVNVTSNTRMVVPPKNPAALSDFVKGDRVRMRLTRGGSVENEARIIVALRRGEEIFLKARTRGFNGTLQAIDESTSTLTVKLRGNKHLNGKDVNNLVGVEGELVTVSYDSNTKFVRKYDGKATIDELVVGDSLFVLGRVGDDGVIAARLIKDESIFRKDVARHAGTVLSVDKEKNTITAKFRTPSVKLEAQNFNAERAQETAGITLTVMYTSTTKFTKNGKEVAEADVVVGDEIRVAGIANVQTKTITASTISLKSPKFHPLIRERDLKEIVKDRIRTAAGKIKDEDIVAKQKDESAEDEDREVESEEEHEEHEGDVI